MIMMWLPLEVTHKYKWARHSCSRAGVDRRLCDNLRHHFITLRIIIIIITILVSSRSSMTDACDFKRARLLSQVERLTTNWVVYITTMGIILTTIFTARRNASTLYAVVVCLCIRLSYASIVSKRLIVESHKQRQTIAQGL